MRTDLQVFAEDGDSQSRNVPRGELEVVDGQFKWQGPQRRLARHARRGQDTIGVSSPGGGGKGSGKKHAPLATSISANLQV